MFRPIAFFLLSVSSLVAQDAASEKSASASFRFFSFDSGDAAPLVVRAQGGVVPVDRPSNRFGMPVRIMPNDHAVSFYDMPPPSEGSGSAKPSFHLDDRARPSVRFQASSAPRQLVVLFPSGAQKRARVFEDGEKHFPPRSVMVVNATGVPLVFSLAGKRQSLTPNKVNVVRIPPAKSGVRTDTPVSIASTPDGKDKLLYSTLWREADDLRYFVIIYQSAEGEVLVRAVSDKVSSYTAEAADEKEKSPAKKPSDRR